MHLSTVSTTCNCIYETRIIIKMKKMKEEDVGLRTQMCMCNQFPVAKLINTLINMASNSRSNLYRC